MPVTVTIQFHARPGQERALVDAVRALIVGRVAYVREGRYSARLFQARDQPDVLLVLAEWESREAHAARQHEEASQRRAIAALCTQPPELRYFTCQARREWMGEAIGLVACTRFHAPPSMAAPLTELMDLWHTIPRDVPGLVSRVLYQDEDDPARLLMVSAWTSAAARDTYEAARRGASKTRVRAQGFTVEYFLGINRAQLDQFSLGHDARPRVGPA